MAGLSRTITEGGTEVIARAKNLLTILAKEEIDLLCNKQMLRKAEADFKELTSHIYYVDDPENGKRLPFKEEIENPNEYLFSKSKVHGCNNGIYRNYALVLWAATGYYGYAQNADILVKYANLNGKKVSNVIDVIFDYESDLLNALAWWIDPKHTADVSMALKESKKRTKSVVYKPFTNQFKVRKVIPPYVDWETAAKAVIGMRVASSDSRKSAQQIKYGKELRPDEKAQFIRDYIKAEKRFENAADDEIAREMQDICDKIEYYASLYPLFNSEKTRDIITTLRRSECLQVSIRQSEYLRRVLQDAEDYHELQTKEKVGADLLDADDFFGF